MTFREAVRATPGLESAFRKGLQALIQADRDRLTVGNSRRLCGSVNLDAALRRGAAANERVWDYGVCYGTTSAKVHWIEVHPASDRGVTEVATKFAWLRRWLDSNGRRLEAFPAAYVWISSGATTFTKTAPSARRLAKHGVISAGAHYRLG